MREFDILVPLSHNDGRPIAPELYQELQRRLLRQFEGMLFFPQPNKGYWKMGGVLYYDEIVVYRVLAERRKTALRFLTPLKKWMERVFEQEEILIIERKVGQVP